MEKDKRLYESADVKVIDFTIGDVITTSGFGETEGGTGNIGADMNTGEW